MAIGYMNTGSVLVWDLASDRQIRTLQVFPRGSPSSLVLGNTILSPDGKRLLIQYSDNTLRTWDVDSGQQLLTLPSPTVADSVGLFFSPDGKLLLVTDCAGKQVALNFETGAVIRTFAEKGCTSDAAFSPDNKLIAIRAQETKVFNFQTGVEVMTAPVRGSGLLLFTPDNALLFASTSDQTSGHTTANALLLHITDLIALAKTRVTRGFTTAECQQYLHVDTCPADSSLGLAPQP